MYTRNSGLKLGGGYAISTELIRANGTPSFISELRIRPTPEAIESHSINTASHSAAFTFDEPVRAEEEWKLTGRGGALSQTNATASSGTPFRAISRTSRSWPASSTSEICMRILLGLLGALF